MEGFANGGNIIKYDFCLMFSNECLNWRNQFDIFRSQRFFSRKTGFKFMIEYTIIIRTQNIDTNVIKPVDIEEICQKIKPRVEGN